MRGIGAYMVIGVRACAAAFQFLTRFPVSVRFEPTLDDLRRSVAFFPAAGLAIGSVMAVGGWLFEQALPPIVSGVLLTIIWVGLTGGLHLDGLMDTADGVLSHRSRERMLEIMKDSRVGAMGVMVGTLALLLRVVLLIALLQLGGTSDLALTALLLGLLLVPVWSRAFLTAAIVVWPYARPEGQGMGGLFRGVAARHSVFAAGCAFVVTWIATGAAGPWSWLGGAAIVACLAALTAGVIGSWIAAAVSRKLGGLTGDVYGAINEGIELGLLLALAAYLYNY